MINFNFIGQLEGNKLNGYVPEPDGGPIESGVTVGGGFDLGQRNSDELPPLLVDKLAMYCGVTGHDAISLLKDNPLTVTESECEIINAYAHESAVKALKRDWSKATPQLFESLLPEAQTVIASVAFQYGSLPKRCPMFWDQAITNNWASMCKNLYSFGDSYTTRRRKERDKLISGLEGVKL